MAHRILMKQEPVKKSEVGASGLTGPAKGTKYAKRLVGRALSIKHVHVASFVAQGKLNGHQICEQAGISDPQLKRMKRLQLFQAEVERQLTVFRKRVAGGYLGMREKRVEMRDELAQALQYIRKSRAQTAGEDTELKAQGGRTGLVLKQNVHNMKTGKVIDHKYVVDHPTIDQLRALAMEQAKDVGDLGGDKPGAAVTIVLTPKEQGWL